MAYIYLGSLAFFLFVIYDINSIVMKSRLLHSCFFIGFFLLIAATAGIIISSWRLFVFDVYRIVIFGAFAAVFLILLLYTLFFALPFKKTYMETEATHEVYQNGVYALCRHPGVLWFIGFYAFFGLAVNIPLLITAAILFSILNILYVIFQDQWTFKKTFDNYDKYKKSTPFLIPNINSFKRCIQTLLGKGSYTHEV